MITESMHGDEQYLSFFLDNEVYALNIQKVREILHSRKITRIPLSPDYMWGVINLRGSVVPVIDLKDKLGLSKTILTVNTCIVIAEIMVDFKSIVVGLLADSVNEVFRLSVDLISPPPRIGVTNSSAFIDGMGKKNEQFIMLLNIDRLLKEDGALLNHPES